MDTSSRGSTTLVSGALLVYLLGALLYCSAESVTPADRALTRGVGVATGAAALLFFCHLMRYLEALVQARESSGGDGAAPPR